MRISVVIPTRNRPDSLVRLLKSIHHQTYEVQEIIIVDSSDDSSYHQMIKNSVPLLPLILVTTSHQSVCIQRNMGIQMAKAEWIFLCDDDLEVPGEYLEKISKHFYAHPKSGAITGLFLQNNGKENAWTEQYPLVSSLELLIRFAFQLSVWGEIKIANPNFLVKWIENYYKRKGNHLSKAGWPVITNFSGNFFKTPIYTLGAAVIKKEWLLNSPYNEVLDPHGIGDNFDVATRFPVEGIDVIKDAFVYHYREPENRLTNTKIYYRRVLALDFFLKTNPQLKHIKRGWFLWSLFGNMMLQTPQNIKSIKLHLKIFFMIVLGKNPYVLGWKSGKKIITPEL